MKDEGPTRRTVLKQGAAALGLAALDAACSVSMRHPGKGTISGNEPVHQLFKFVQHVDDVPEAARSLAENFSVHPNWVQAAKDGRLSNVGISDVGDRSVTVIDFAIAQRKGNSSVIEALANYGAAPTIVGFDLLEQYLQKPIVDHRRGGDFTTATDDEKKLSLLKNKFPSVFSEYERSKARGTAERQK